MFFRKSFDLGEDIWSREAHEPRLIAWNENNKSYWTQKIHRLSVPLLNANKTTGTTQSWTTRTRYWKIQLLNNGLNSLHVHLAVIYAPFNVYGNVITPQTVPMTKIVVIAQQLQRHVRISTSFDSIWIIDSLEARKHYDRQLG